MSSHKPAIDLDSLPPVVRQQVEAGLAKLSPEARKQLLEEGSPMLERAIARAKAKAGAAGVSMARATPPAVHLNSRGQYNNTVMPGDRFSLRSWMLVLATLAGAAYLFSQ